MANPRVRQIRLEDFRHVAENMRDCDKFEVWQSHNHTPYEALRYSVDCSHYAMVATDGKDIPYCMFGVAAITPLSICGSPWMLGTTDIVEHRAEFLKWSRVYIKEMKQMHPRLENYVHAENHLSIDWLKWSGFFIDKPAPYGKENDLFRRFWMGVKYV